MNSIPYFNEVIIIGILQGTILAILLFVKKTSQSDSKLLGALLLVFNIICLKTLFHNKNNFDNSQLKYFPFSVELLVSPVLYFYVKSISQPYFKFSKKWLVHLVPFILFFTYSVLVYFKVFFIEDINEKDKIANAFQYELIKFIEDILSIFSLIFYWVLSFRLVKNYRRNYFQKTSGTDIQSLNWLKIFLVIFGIFVVFLPISIFLNQIVLWQLFHIGLIIAVYYGGFKGFLSNPSKLVEENRQKTEIIEVEQKQVWSIEQRDLTKSKILEVFDNQKIYRDQNFTLQKLSNLTELPQNLLSSVINVDLNSNFRKLVNDYRIKEIKIRIKSADLSKMTIAGLALECGFNSEASFYRVFKADVGLSPKEFIIS